MIKYVATAAALKALSTSRFTRKLYRSVGNVVGARGRARSVMPRYYVERVQRMLDLNHRFDLLRDGMQLLELGTGWMHWEALTTRLFFTIKADLYDVWDNRQLEALKSYLTQLLAQFDRLTSATSNEKQHATGLAKEIGEQTDFTGLYDLLGFRYILDPDGTLADLSSDSYDLVVSAGVFEHLPRAGVPHYINQTFRVLKPGGYAVHSINTADHLYLYDKTTSPKYYLHFSDKQWRTMFENRLQYINRLQRCEWMEIFRQAGFVCVEETSSRCDLGRLKISKQFQQMDRLSLETTSWFAVYRKPVE